MIDRLQRAGATPKAIEQIQGNQSLLDRFEEIADQDIHEILLDMRRAERAAKAEVEEDVDKEPADKAAAGKAAKSESASA
jgi:hypothetical protein